ncbi:phage tail protein [Spartinivicinus poritis]|uniref:Phage tail protein n=1 Tax=Spartinivicinus poritis TaxID=2994640 RepID=A0ABT5U2Z3_9GAMM|nr:phage tail protein [Spartinivicinus sp. A2-2]MDE1460667.1 phage tail protein [Spartinivicinus sp. A2-2]
MLDDLLFDAYIPPVFYFSVYVSGFLGETSFTEVSGLDYTIATEALSEGGSEATYQVPKSASPVTYSDLVLKRGIASSASQLGLWCINCTQNLTSNSIKSKDITVTLLNPDGLPVRVWYFTQAYPVKWSVDSFNSTENKLAIETITLKHGGFTRIL